MSISAGEGKNNRLKLILLVTYMERKCEAWAFSEGKLLWVEQGRGLLELSAEDENCGICPVALHIESHF